MSNETELLIQRFDGTKVFSRTFKHKDEASDFARDGERKRDVNANQQIINRMRIIEEVV